jgi:hypothetical protein
MVPGSYVPEDETEYAGIIYYLSPNTTTIDYKSSLNDFDVVFHLELNSNKLGKNKRPVKKFSIRLLNRSNLDEIYYPHSQPNQTVPPRVPSRGMYDRLNPISTTPDLKDEEEDLFTNKKEYRKKIRSYKCLFIQ